MNMASPRTRLRSGVFELVIELGDVSEDGESVGSVTLRHVLGVQQGGNTQLCLSQREGQGTVSETEKNIHLCLSTRPAATFSQQPKARTLGRDSTIKHRLSGKMVDQERRAS